jgi:hypothetical protein
MNFDQVSHKPPYVKAEWLVPQDRNLPADGPCLLQRVRNPERFGHCLRGGVDEVHGSVIFQFAAPDDQVTQADSPPSSLAAYLRTSLCRDPSILTRRAEMLKC